MWVTVDGDALVLGDGRRVRAESATHLAPCEPTKIIAIHLNYPSRRVEFGVDFPIDYLVADLSRHITLLPGDVILSGTPANSRPMANGDVVEVEIEGIGRLTNRVVEIPSPAHEVGHQPTDSQNVRAVALGLGKRGGMSQ